MCMGTNEYTKQMQYGRKERKNKGANGQTNNFEKKISKEKPTNKQKQKIDKRMKDGTEKNQTN